jgi:hypothetical protein
MNLRTLLSAASVSLALLSPCRGQGDEAAEEVLEAISAYDRAQAEFAARVEGARDDERRGLLQKRPSAHAAIEKAQAFVKASPDHAKVPEVASWLMPYLRDDDRSFVYEALSEHHLAHEDLATAILSVLYDQSEVSTEFLTTVLERGKAAQAKAAAAFVLGYRMRDGDEEDAEKKAEYLRMAVKDLGDLEVRGRKVKAIAEGQLFAAENLAIGKVAPEIEGEDIDGVVFKLSDYRGKVVVIDFWGHW